MKIKTNKLLLPILLPALSIALSANHAAAQETDNPPPDSAALTLEEITVFARRRAESLQDVPISVTAVTEEQIERRGLTNLTELTTILPNTIIDSQQGGQTTIRIYIRGNGTQDRNSSSDPSVGIYLDGVYLGKNRGVNLDLFDLESVEVLRGPQGTLFGRNTTAGALIVHTKQPDFDDNAFKAETRLGSFGRQDARLYGNLSLSDSVAVNGSIASLRSDGYFTNQVTGNDIGGDDSLSGRVAFRFAPSEDLEFTLGGDYTKIDTTPVGNIVLIDEVNPTGLLGPEGPLFGPGSVIGLPNFYDAFGGLTPGVTTGTLNDPHKVYQNQDGLQDFEIYGLRGNVKYDISDTHELEIISSYRNHSEVEMLDFEGTSIPIADSSLAEEYSQLSLEAKISSNNSGPYNYTAGATYFENDSESRQAADISDFTGDSMSVYGEATYDISDKTAVFAGVRYVADDRSISRFIAATGTTTDISDTSSGFAGRIGLNFQSNEDLLLYGVYARGYKSGSFNLFPPGNAAEGAFDPETVDSFEVGFKSELFDNRVRFNTALFYAIYDDLQVITVDSPIVSATILNAGESTSYGIETEINYILTDHFRLSGTLGLMDASFDDDKVVLGLQNREIPLSPDATGSLSVNYENYLSGLGAQFTAGLTAAYRSDYANGVGDGQTPNQYIEPSRWLLDANMGLEFDKVYVNVIVKNLTDKDYFAQVLPLDSLGIAPATAGAPRSVEVSLGVRF